MRQNNPGDTAAGAIIPGGDRAGARDTPYLVVLLALLMSVTIFEGYDVTIFHLCTPDIVRTFHLSDLDFGIVASLVRLGGLAAFAVVMIADRVGRKAMVSRTVLFYTLFTLLTALSTGLRTFTIFQCGAQLFLSAEFGVATIMVGEEFPDRWRGSGIALLNMVGLGGVIAGGLLYAPVAGSHWGWRGMYLIGVLPLLAVAVLRRYLRETARFEELQVDGRMHLSVAASLRGSIVEAWRSLSGPYRGRLLLVAVLWNSYGIVGTPAVTFFALYAGRDHHWTRAEIGSAVVLAYTIGTLGHLLAGYMLDRVGRKPTTCMFYVVGAISIFILFQSTTHGAMLAAMIVTVFAFQGARTTTTTYSTELFPTAIRATSYSLTVQVLGQIATLLTPITIGALSRSLGGLGNAVAAVAIGPVIGAIVVALYAPETRGMRLEELALPDRRS